MKATHTPGPWTIGTNGDRCAKGHAICAGPHVLAKVYGTGYPIGEGWAPQSQADAHLIAAAPDLLAVVNALLAWYDENGGMAGPHAGSMFDNTRTWNDTLIAAIAHAQGDSKV